MWHYCYYRQSLFFKGLNGIIDPIVCYKPRIFVALSLK